MTGQKEKNRAALLSLCAALVLTSIKLGIGLYTNSLGILSEALHSGFDLIAAGITLVAVRVAMLPADAKHPYGHGKAENIAALAETALLAITSVWIVHEGYMRLRYGGSPVLPSLWGAGIMIFSIAIDVNRARMLRAVAKKYNSQALEADALHFWSDIWSSGVVLAGVLAVWAGKFLPAESAFKPWLDRMDAFAALCVSLIILKSCYCMGKRAINALLDGDGQEKAAIIEQAVAALPGITAVKNIRIRTSGPYNFIDLAIGVAPDIRVTQGHSIAHQVEQNLTALIDGADVTVHVEPVPPTKQAYSHPAPFPLIHQLADEHGLHIHSLHILEDAGHIHAEVHVEIHAAMPFGAAYARVTSFEKDIHAALPLLELITHIEPEQAIAQGAQHSLPPAELEHISQCVARLAQQHGLSHCHRIKAYTCSTDIGEEQCLSLHCLTAAENSVAQTHTLATALEAAIRQELPQLHRITVHLEPQQPA